jgi:hypothetical protein
MKQIGKKSAVIVCALSMSACASIVGGRYEQVRVETRTDDQSVHANCTLSNGISQVSLTTPATAKLHRSSYDLNVVCEKDGRQISQQTYDSGIHGMVWGNFVIGGGVGIAIDFYNGAARGYPDQLTVQLPSSYALAPSHSGSSYPNVNVNVDQGGAYASLPSSVAGLASLDARVSKNTFNAAQNTAAAHQCDRAIRVVSIDGRRSTFRSQCSSTGEMQIQCAGDACIATQTAGVASNR